MTIDANEIFDRRVFDVIVVGAGNAATCAALSARENGARVVMLEIAPEDKRGGNSAFTGGLFASSTTAARTSRLILDMNTELRDAYSRHLHRGAVVDDMGRLTQYRCDPDLIEILIRGSFDAALWMRQ